jgi:hypothetical protein
MNDSSVLESLVVTSDSRAALSITGGACMNQLEVTENALLSHVDVQKSINVGADVNICGELRCDKLFHTDKTDKAEEALIWRINHMPDTHSCNRKRYDLGSNVRRWENVWTHNTHAHRIDTSHMVSDTARVGAIEATSIVAETVQASILIHSYATVQVDTGSVIDLTSQITIVYPINATVPIIDVQPVGMPGCRLEVVAMGAVTLRLPSGICKTLQTGTSIRLLNVDDSWIAYH